jgi:hypothetical protein
VIRTGACRDLTDSYIVHVPSRSQHHKIALAAIPHFGSLHKIKSLRLCSLNTLKDANRWFYSVRLKTLLGGGITVASTHRGRCFGDFFLKQRASSDVFVNLRAEKFDFLVRGHKSSTVALTESGKQYHKNETKHHVLGLLLPYETSHYGLLYEHELNCSHGYQGYISAHVIETFLNRLVLPFQVYADGGSFGVSRMQYCHEFNLDALPSSWFSGGHSGGLHSSARTTPMDLGLLLNAEYPIP